MMKPLKYEFAITLPHWLQAHLHTVKSCIPERIDRMRFVIGLSRKNVEYGAGGPFAAAVFDNTHNRMISAGVNVVEPSACSIAHAEVMALTLAQQRAGSHNLRGVEGIRFELVTSTEPCAMCFGAVQWSGVQSLVCGATAEDARNIGFDEGARPADWAGELEKRGITVAREVCRSEAAGVLVDYAKMGGSIYNPG